MERFASGDAGYRYRVFLSYSHADRAWARRLARQLETWRVPKSLVGRAGSLGRIPDSLGPVFRDRDELSASAELGATITGALRDAHSMVVICSEDAARSAWVNEEIRTFKALGRAERIFAFIISGDPAAGDAPGQCLPPALRHAVDAAGRVTNQAAEPLAADARSDGDGFKRARLRLFAGLLGVGYDRLRQREQHRRTRRLALVAMASMIGMVLTVGLAVSAWMARQDADRRREQAEDLIGFMVGDLRAGLEPIGKLELLGGVGDKALAYFASLNSRDLSERMLDRQAQALVQVGEVKLGLGDSESALEAFTRALERGRELVERSPATPGYHFRRGQAEFWLGEVYFRRGEFEWARSWFTRYRDTSQWLTESKPDQADWALEAAFAEMNLGAVSMELGRLEDAAVAYESARDAMEAMLTASPGDPALLDPLAEARSWLGSIRRSQGRLAESEHQFRAALSVFDELRRRGGGDRYAEERWVREWAQLCRNDLIRGRYEDALDTCQQARDGAERLVLHDPLNQRWRRTFAYALLACGEASLELDRLAAAREAIDAGMAEFEALSGGDPSDADWRSMLASAYRLSARLELAEGDPLAAGDMARAGLAILAEGGTEGATLRARIARTRLLQVAGDAAERVGDGAMAQQLWADALTITVERTEEEGDVFFMSLRAGLLSSLGRCAESRALDERLAGMGVARPWRQPCALLVSGQTE